MQERVAEKQRNVQMKHLTKSCKVVVWISDWPPVSASALSRDHSERNNKKKKHGPGSSLTVSQVYSTPFMNSKNSGKPRSRQFRGGRSNVLLPVTSSEQY